MEKLSPCSKCGCMTKSIRVSRANWRCGKCNHDKTLSDVYFEEAVNKSKSNINNDTQQSKLKRKTKQKDAFDRN